MYRIILIFLFVLMASGFKLLTTSRWKISSASPTLWIRMCSKMQSWSLTGAGGATISGTLGLASVINDFNNVNSSYLRFAAYPADPANPGSPAPGDTTFTVDIASQRTIEVCSYDPSNPFEGGGATLDEEDGDIIGCDIQISDDVKKDYDKFIRTLTHELGHCAGLDHPQETKHAIMSYFAKRDKQRLLIDDKMGLVYLYPKDGVDVQEKATFGLQCSTD